MNMLDEWSGILIAWLSNASPKTQGLKLAASRWVQDVYYIHVHVLACRWKMKCANHCRLSHESQSFSLKCPFDLAIIVSPEQSSADTMVLASSRRVRRRRDFLVSTLPAAFLVRSSSNLA